MMLPLWILCAAVTVTAYLLAPSSAISCTLGLWSLIPLLSWTVLFLNRSRLKLQISCPATGQKGRSVPLTITVDAPRCLPVGAMRLRIEGENTVTGEKQCFSVTGEAGRGLLQSRFCGCIRLRVVRVTVWEAFGIFPLVLRDNQQRQICILPETFPVQIVPSASPAASDCSEYDPGSRGTDPTEIYQNRDYVPGDSLQQIHWKLSAKANHLIVRDPARPMDRTLGIFVARQKAPPAFADALMEAAVSVCQALDGQPYTLMWNADTICRREISGTDALLEALTELMKAPAQEQLPPWDAPQEGRLLYFCCRPPEFLPENATVFLCSDTGQADVSFTPDTMREKLEKLTWSS